MAGNGTTYQDIILLREYLQHFQTFYFHPFVTQLACHAHTFEYTGRIRRTTYGTRSSLTVVLTVGSFTYTAESVAFYNTLEAFTFGSSHNVNNLTFSEDLAGDGFAERLGNGRVRIAEFFNVTFRGGLCFREVILFCFGGVFFFLVTKCYLYGIVPVGGLGFHLGNNAWASFDNGAGSLLTIGLEDTGHANLFTNNTFHLLYNLAQRLRDLQLSSG